MAKAAATRKDSKKRQREFVLAYVANGFRGSDAAVSVGYSVKSARFIASELLAKPNIAQQIKELVDDYFGTMKMGASETLGRLAMIARSDIRMVRDAQGRWIEPADIESAACVAGVEFDEVVEKDEDGNETRRVITRKVKLRDPVPALDKLALHRLIDSDQPVVKALPDGAGVDLELVRRIAFALGRANAQTLPVIEGK